MKGAIFFSTKYGSTEQYAKWISEATNLPAIDIKSKQSDPSAYEFLVVGCPVIYYQLTNRKWVKRHLKDIQNKPVIFFTVSGAPAGKDLDGWIAKSLPKSLISRMYHIALRGRQNPSNLTFFDRTMMIIGSWFTKDPKVRKEELEGFDFMDKSSIEPIVELVCKFKSQKPELKLGIAESVQQ